MVYCIIGLFFDDKFIDLVTILKYVFGRTIFFCWLGYVLFFLFICTAYHVWVPNDSHLLQLFFYRISVILDDKQ